MDAKLLRLILLCLAGGLLYIIGFWRRKAAEAAFAAAQTAGSEEQRDRFCRMAALAGHRDACRMFCLARPDLFEDRLPLKPFKSHGIWMTFYGHYYPARYKDLLSDEQRAFCRSLYRFKEGEIHGIEFFKACMTALQLDKIRPTLQTPRLVYRQAPAGVDIGAVRCGCVRSARKPARGQGRREPHPRTELQYHGKY